VLFLDEPTTGLDPRGRNEVWAAVRAALVAGGTTVLLTTQYLDEADQLADRVSVIDQGRVIAEGTPDQLKSELGGDRIDVVVSRADQLAALTRRPASWHGRHRRRGHRHLLFMVMVVLLFGYLFGGAMTVPGGGSYREFLLPGMFALSMLFGVEATMVAVTTDAAKGVTDRFRAMPMARSAVVAGRGIADMLNSVLGLGVLLACGLLVGWRWHGSAAATLAAVGLLLLRFALVWVGVCLGLLVRNPEAVVAVQVHVWPLGFLSNAIAPTATMPGWLGVVAEWNRCRPPSPPPGSCSATPVSAGSPGPASTPSCRRWPGPCSSWPCSFPWRSTAGSG
jgi:hypothetical protein